MRPGSRSLFDRQKVSKKLAPKCQPSFGGFPLSQDEKWEAKKLASLRQFSLLYPFFIPRHRLAHKGQLPIRLAFGIGRGFARCASLLSSIHLQSTFGKAQSASRSSLAYALPLSSLQRRGPSVVCNVSLSPHNISSVKIPSRAPYSTSSRNICMRSPFDTPYGLLRANDVQRCTTNGTGSLPSQGRQGCHTHHS